MDEDVIDVTNHEEFVKRMREAEQGDICPCYTCDNECRNRGYCALYVKWSKKVYGIKGR